MLSSFCANCSAQSVSNYSMPSARASIQPETMLISKKEKKDEEVRKHIKIFQGCGPLQRLGTTGLYPAFIGELDLRLSFHVETQPTLFGIVVQQLACHWCKYLVRIYLPTAMNIF